MELIPGYDDWKTTNYINLCVRFVTGTMYNLSFVKRKILGTKSSGY